VCVVSAYRAQCVWCVCAVSVVVSELHYAAAIYEWIYLSTLFSFISSLSLYLSRFHTQQDEHVIAPSSTVHLIVNSQLRMVQLRALLRAHLQEAHSNRYMHVLVLFGSVLVRILTMDHIRLSLSLSLSVSLALSSLALFLCPCSQRATPAHVPISNVPGCK